ncbi:hypothetical protein SELMODRAFT_91226 [Selaginella moellendorffii]|uniref:FAD dependent oxidoreductase domain-containing protein n=1 Tax=Selaginella moellendorffii TaxID=88036 RepID=D8RDW8_SELML|nr:putative oxidoreductase TDA3 [Selaginella moellendorffii]EFJ29569.1 hypothetical protein SELMODRAFT_91226 [Selaginella moellendorffii]|eukprot:XP_002969481.1 putative oxidoreductase TDA3 [Selaginella moellendorffii]
MDPTPPTPIDPSASSSSSSSDPSPSPGHAIVCGAGVIGACTAYFLAKKGVRVTVVERCSVACAASGKAGGFLALDWCDGSPLGKLARASFLMHQRLAAELDGAHRYGYRPLDTLSLVVEEPRSGTDNHHAGGGEVVNASTPSVLPSWTDGPVKGATPIGNQTTTAQVHPALFTQAVLSAAEAEFGVRVIRGEVEELRLDPHRMKLLGVVVDKELIPAEVAVVALGPWSSNLSSISDLTRISGRKAHSIVVRPKSSQDLTPHALLLRYKTREGKQLAPEVYPRPTGEVYVSGMSEEAELPATAHQVKPRNEAVAMLRRVSETVSSHLQGAELETAQACFMPLSEDGRPLIGKLPNVEGAYVATGHGYWGILNGPATGAFLSELIVDGECKTLDLKYFDPARFFRNNARRKDCFL